MAEARCDLNPAEGARRFRQDQLAPVDPEAARWVDGYWLVDWNLPADDPYRHESVPDPALHLVIEAGRSRLVGVCTGRFTYDLTGRGRIVGARLLPGTAWALTGRPASSVTDTVIALAEVFPGHAAALETAVLDVDPDDPAGAVAVLEGFVREIAPPVDERVELVREVMAAIAADRSIRTVGHVVDRFAVSRRTLQRLFADQVGVGPKWVIRRWRLIEAADALLDAPQQDWAALAAELGYFDQAHFVNDFTTVVGRPPGAHARLASASAG